MLGSVVLAGVLVLSPVTVSHTWHGHNNHLNGTISCPTGRHVTSWDAQFHLTHPNQSGVAALNLHTNRSVHVVLQSGSVPGAPPLDGKFYVGEWVKLTLICR